jgi:hypothetical protein
MITKGATEKLILAAMTSTPMSERLKKALANLKNTKRLTPTSNFKIEGKYGL